METSSQQRQSSRRDSVVAAAGTGFDQTAGPTGRPIDLFAALAGCETPEAFAAQLNAARVWLGLPWGLAQAHTGADDTVVLMPTPAEFGLAGKRGAAVASFAPVLRHVRTTTMPVVWDAAPIHREGAGEGEFYGVLASFEASRQLVVTLADALTSCQVSARIQIGSPCDTGARLLEQVVQVHLFTLHLAEAARAACLPRQVSPLGPRELQVLRLTIEGCQTWEIANALRLSESMTSRIGRDAAQALGCLGKHRAAARALHMGWLDAAPLPTRRFRA